MNAKPRRLEASQADFLEREALGKLAAAVSMLRQVGDHGPQTGQRVQRVRSLRRAISDALARHQDGAR